MCIRDRNCIDEYIKIISRLMDTGYAYFAGGNVYFDTSKLEKYYVFNDFDADDLDVGAVSYTHLQSLPLFRSERPRLLRRHSRRRRSRP